MQNPREIALRVLRRHGQTGDYVEDVLAPALAEPGWTPANRGLCQELVYGVVRWRATLDWLVAGKTNGRPQRPDIQNLLRLGLYQIFWLDRVPDHAAVNETVRLAREFGLGPQAGFVNAVLRGHLREQAATRQRLLAARRDQPAIGWSHPEWLVERWRNAWGDDATLALLEWNNRPPATFARRNTLVGGGFNLLEQWRLKEGVEYALGRWDWVPENLMFELRQHPPLESLESFRRGAFYVQDPSTVLAAGMLNPQAGDQVLDFCAAPGGKTTLLAQMAGDRCEIFAQDLDESRLALIRENCRRLGVTAVREVFPTGDRERVLGDMRFDQVLVDAPCSNTGVMRRRVDLRWRIRSEEIVRLGRVQRELLEAAAKWLKPAGRLVYSTCSLERGENGGVVREFLAGHPEFRLATERQLTPMTDGVDGAYAAALERGE